MKSIRFCSGVLGLMVLLAAGCGGNPTHPVTSSACGPASRPEAAYVLTGYAVNMYTVDSCTGQFTATTPASVGTGYTSPHG